MSDAEFDRHAGHYRQVHQANIAASGELPEYFAHYKMRDFAALVRAAGLPQSGRYLDFGSGIGSSVKPFMAELPAARLACADVSQESLALSQAEHGDTVDYLALGEEGRLPAADGSFDGAFACCVFHHIDGAQHDAVLRELRRVVKPGGLLMIYEHNPYNPLTVRAVNTCPLDENAVLIKAGEMRRRCIAAGWQAEHDYRVFFPAMLKGLRQLEDHLRWLPLGAQYYIRARA